MMTPPRINPASIQSAGEPIDGIVGELPGGEGDTTGLVNVGGCVAMGD